MEVLLILGIALLIFGPKKLPEVGRTLGRGLGEFRRATTELKRTIEREVDLDERDARKPTPRLVEPSTQGSSSARSSPSSAEAPAADASPSPATASATATASSGDPGSDS